MKEKVDEAVGTSMTVRRLEQEQLTSSALADIPSTVDEVMEAATEPRPKRQKLFDKPWWQR